MESKREEMLDLERVDWITDGISGTGFASISVMLIWFLVVLLSFRCSAIVADDEEEAKVSARNGIAFFFVKKKKIWLWLIYEERKGNCNEE